MTVCARVVALPTCLAEEHRQGWLWLRASISSNSSGMSWIVTEGRRSLSPFVTGRDPRLHKPVEFYCKAQAT